MTSNFVCGSVASRAHSIVKQAAVHQSSSYLGQKGTVAPAAPWLFSMFFVRSASLSLFRQEKKWRQVLQPLSTSTPGRQISISLLCTLACWTRGSTTVTEVVRRCKVIRLFEMGCT
jgi:hypothetical protein